MEELKLPSFINELSDYLIGIKNLSETYIRNMCVTLQQFLEFINVHKFKNKYNYIKEMSINDIRSLSNSDIYSFMFFLAECHYKINSRIVKTEHLKTFFDYLYTIKHSVFQEPFKKLQTEKKVEQKLPNYLSLDESKKILNLYANSTKNTEIRDHAILHLFLNCGLRLSEMSNLNIDDFNFDEDKFNIIGKGNKERIGYLNKPTKEALLKYLKIRTKNKSTSSKALFISNFGLRTSVSTIKHLVKKAYLKADINNDKYSAHTLRHTCATLLYRNGTDIKIIQELLGHVQIDTTEIYTHLHDQEVMDAMNSHPLAKFKMANAMEYCAA